MADGTPRPSLHLAVALCVGSALMDFALAAAGFAEDHGAAG